jgi:hypothetical protein
MEMFKLAYYVFLKHFWAWCCMMWRCKKSFSSSPQIPRHFRVLSGEGQLTTNDLNWRLNITRITERGHKVYWKDFSDQSSWLAWHLSMHRERFRSRGMVEGTKIWSDRFLDLRVREVWRVASISVWRLEIDQVCVRWSPGMREGMATVEIWSGKYFKFAVDLRWTTPRGGTSRLKLITWCI